MNKNSISDADFDLFRQKIYDASGITFSHSNRSILDSRLREQLRISNHESLQDYYKIIASNANELKHLLDLVTTNLTSFFRNLPQMDTLINHIIPELVALKKAACKNHIRVWSAGCSTGEEPYTLAMILKTHLPATFTFEIVASDISIQSLEIAKEGFYQTNKIEGIPEEYLKKFLTPVENGYQMNSDLMKSIAFKYHNLKTDTADANFDIVFCRNVLIYFDEIVQNEVIDKFWSALNNTGFLIIGHSESLFGMQTNFEFVKTDWSCLYKKN
ncbi:MAG: CheR family methyltransferase [Treponemataceae bacterium]